VRVRIAETTLYVDSTEVRVRIAETSRYVGSKEVRVRIVETSRYVGSTEVQVMKAKSVKQVPQYKTRGHSAWLLAVKRTLIATTKLKSSNYPKGNGMR